MAAIKKIADILINILSVVGLFAVIFALACLIMSWKPGVIMSGSMEPEIPTGSVVLVDTDLRDPQIGDVILFDKGGTLQVTHRVIEKVEDGYITKGDNNENEDIGIVLPSEVVGTVVFDVPKIGYVIKTLANPPVFIMLVAFIICLFIASKLNTNKEDITPQNFRTIWYGIKDDDEAKLACANNALDIFYDRWKQATAKSDKKRVALTGEEKEQVYDALDIIRNDLRAMDFKKKKLNSEKRYAIEHCYEIETKYKALDEFPEEERKEALQENPAEVLPEAEDKKIADKKEEIEKDPAPVKTMQETQEKEAVMKGMDILKRDGVSLPCTQTEWDKHYAQLNDEEKQILDIMMSVIRKNKK